MSLPEPYYQDEAVTLYCGDALEVLAEFQPNSADLVLTDPPYESEAHTKQRRVKRRAFASGGEVMAVEALPFAPISEAARAIAANQIADIARRWVLTFCQIEAAPQWRTAYEDGGLTYKRTCLWIKPDGMPQYSGDRPGMGYETILAMHVSGRSRWNGGGTHGVFTFRKGENGGLPNLHQTQKPLALISHLMTLFSEPGSTVLDPFAGSGTSLLAAKNLGRRAIGIEMNEAHCETIVKRLAQGVLPLESV